MLVVCQDHLHSQEDWPGCTAKFKGLGHFFIKDLGKKSWEVITDIRPISDVCFFETGSPCITQAILELTAILLSQLSSAGITDMNYHMELI